jgi:hypothetical protein
MGWNASASGYRYLPAGQEALADTLLIETLRQLIAQDGKRNLFAIRRINPLRNDRLPLLLNSASAASVS